MKQRSRNTEKNKESFFEQIRKVKYCIEEKLYIKYEETVINILKKNRTETQI